MIFHYISLYFIICKYGLIVTSPQHHAIWNHGQLDSIFQQLVQNNNKDKIKSPNYWPFVTGIRRWLKDSPDNVSVRWKRHHVMTSSYCEDVRHQCLECNFHSAFFYLRRRPDKSDRLNEPLLQTSWTSQWHHNERDGVSNHQPHDCLLNRSDQRKHQSSAPLAFVRGIHRGPLKTPHKRPVTRNMTPFDDVFMKLWWITREASNIKQVVDQEINLEIV